jgi:uncharacterized protein (TIGR02118 family)
MIRLTFVLRRKPGATREEFQEYWRRAHAPLVAQHADTLDLLRYVQVHTFDDPANEQMAAARGGMEAPYDGVAELWWSSRDALRATGQDGRAATAAAALIEDEARFIDLAASPLWFAYEYPQINPTPENIVAEEGSSIVKLFYCLRERLGQPADEAQWYWRTHHGPFIRRRTHHSGGALRYVQVHRAEEEMGAAARQARGTTAEPYLGHAELWFDRNRPAAPPRPGDGGNRAVVEDESRFADFSRSAMWFAKEHVVMDRR